jgi:hypothetical protein
LKYLKDEECVGETVRKANSLTHFVMEINFNKFMAQLVFNSPLLPTSQNNLARKRPMTPESLATPLGITHRV